MNGYCDIHGLPITSTSGQCEQCTGFQPVPISTTEWADLQQKIIDLDAKVEKLRDALNGISRHGGQ